MAKYLCTERCFDSQRCVSYYEDTVYELGKTEIAQLKNSGHFKRFQSMPVAEPPQEPEPEAEAGRAGGRKAKAEAERE